MYVNLSFPPIRQELVDYKLRAKKVLQEKEAIIGELTGKFKEGSSEGGDTQSQISSFSDVSLSVQGQLRASQVSPTPSHPT